ncbi:hypothetical protein GCM10007424_19970 [Flavobacterium suaedae]|uniref:RHS repeat protein n=1 Tax=Flavobacterium suaedae TaxID=1767027 RepID=A0ABQ1K0Y8_9FLAO|nr:hypothetical protein [Flavobacterium suaedae]GGB79842.1 hypothetical protein GCM10007424_19970 [Flavobacterium suaedae]
MKYTYSLAIALFVLISCKKEDKVSEQIIDRSNTDWEFYSLKGNVKSISLKSNEIDKTNLDANIIKHEISTEHNKDLEFNEVGMLVLEKKQNSSGGPYEQTKYNGQNKKLEKIQYINNEPGIKTVFEWNESGENNTSITRRNPDNSQIDRKVLKYEAGKLAEKLTFNRQDKLVDKVTYVYDDNGNLTGENLYLNNDKVVVKNAYKYNENNQKVSYTRYDKNSEILFNTQYEYKGDNLILEETRGKEGEVEYSRKMTYDDNGNMLSKISYDSYDDSETIEKFVYDGKGNKVTWDVQKNGEPFLKINYTYNENGDVTGVRTYNNIGKAIEERKYTYNYDKEGNWIKKSIYIDGELKFVEQRDITYYN